MENIRFDFKDFELVAIVGAVDALHRECSEKNNGKRKKNFSVLFIFFFGGGGGENPVQFSLDIFERISIYVLILRL